VSRCHYAHARWTQSPKYTSLKWRPISTCVRPCRHPYSRAFASDARLFLVFSGFRRHKQKEARPDNSAADRAHATVSRCLPTEQQTTTTTWGSVSTFCSSTFVSFVLFTFYGSFFLVPCSYVASQLNAGENLNHCSLRSAHVPGREWPASYAIWAA
jgi:hypothetical protein